MMTEASPSHDTREHILAVAEPMILGRGFTAVGLTELLTAAGVPKGSFYHYFRSKEHFGEALLERYFAGYASRMETLFADGVPGPMRDRLLAYFASWLHGACDIENHGSCLAVKRAGEVCELSEPMREALAHGMNQVVGKLSAAIAAAVADGSTTAGDDCDALAEALYSMWLGAALRTKVLRDPAPLQRALDETRRRLPQPD